MKKKNEEYEKKNKAGRMLNKERRTIRKKTVIEIEKRRMK